MGKRKFPVGFKEMVKRGEILSEQQVQHTYACADQFTCTGMLCCICKLSDAGRTDKRRMQIEKYIAKHGLKKENENV